MLIFPSLPFLHSCTRPLPPYAIPLAAPMRSHFIDVNCQSADAQILSSVLGRSRARSRYVTRHVTTGAALSLGLGRLGELTSTQHTHTHTS